MLWYETYVKGWRKKQAEWLRDDALCLGQLYHAGQEQLLRTNSIEIPQEVIDAETPKPEALQMVRGMLAEYQMWAGNEPWEVITIEKPLEFVIQLPAGDVFCMAKLDASVLVREACEIPSGIPGQVLLLEPGYYTLEHKTKAATSNRAQFLRRWELDKQPLFQQMGLSEYVKQHPELPQLAVRGTIINVAEKPTIYVPVRTCKGCKYKQDMSTYTIKGAMFVCTLCGFANEFAAPKKTSTYDPTTFYRIKLDQHDIEQEVTKNMLYSVCTTYDGMQALRTGGPDEVTDPYLGYSRCNGGYYGPCVFVDIHTYRATHDASVELHQIDTTKYMKETKL